MSFEWDEKKNLANQRKHGISFEEASQILNRDSTLEIFDDAHSESEDRFFSIGPIKKGLVVVIWTERDEEVLRIISARRATSHESKLYHQHMEKYHE